MVVTALRRRWRGKAHALPLALLILACREPRVETPVLGRAGLDTAAASSGVVDSILPVEEEIRRFRVAVPEVSSALTGGEATRDGLVRRWVRALEAADTAAIVRMAVTPAEFITFYYPGSQFTRPPYRQSPRLRWFLMDTQSSQGLGRVLERHAGQPFDFVSYRCDPEPTMVGQLRLWSNCMVRRTVDGTSAEMRFFTGIVERDGRFKFLTFASDY